MLLSACYASSLLLIRHGAQHGLLCRRWCVIAAALGMSLNFSFLHLLQRAHNQLRIAGSVADEEEEKVEEKQMCSSISVSTFHMLKS